MAGARSSIFICLHVTSVTTLHILNRFMYGVAAGSFVCWVGYLVGASVGFAAARYAFKDWFYRRTRNSVFLSAVQLAVHSHAFALVLLLQVRRNRELICRVRRVLIVATTKPFREALRIFFLNTLFSRREKVIHFWSLSRWQWNFLVRNCRSGRAPDALQYGLLLFRHVRL